MPYKSSVDIALYDVQGSGEYKLGAGYFAEALIKYNFNDRYSIFSGINYNVSTIKLHSAVSVTEFSGKLHKTYMSLPLMFKVKAFESVPLGISLGTYVGFLLSAKEKGDIYMDRFIGGGGTLFSFPEPMHLEYDDDIKENFTSHDFGISLQLDYEFKLNDKLKAVALSRFNYGLKDVASYDESVLANTRKWRNYSIMLGVGVKI
ncbi:PorT family protein [Labilibacter sediminis]|nr:PorT family protein [Labilibacter sediminis]